MKRDFKAKLEKLGVAIVSLFGSKATGKASPLSDIDIGIVLKSPASKSDPRTLYPMIYQLFCKATHLRPAKGGFVQGGEVVRAQPSLD